MRRDWRYSRKQAPLHYRTQRVQYRAQRSIFLTRRGAFSFPGLKLRVPVRCMHALLSALHGPYFSGTVVALVG